MTDRQDEHALDPWARFEEQIIGEVFRPLDIAIVKHWAAAWNPPGPDPARPRMRYRSRRRHLGYTRTGRRR